MLLPKLAPPDTQLNMTPMIDIVFQLILFFLFNLRFKSADYRIDAMMPKDVGLDRTPVPVDPLPRIVARLTRGQAEDPVAARTTVRLGGSEWVLPPISAAAKERQAAFARIASRIGTLREETGRPGVIETPVRSGALVPHADVMGVLDAFLEANVFDVAFEGTPSPLPGAR